MDFPDGYNAAVARLVKMFDTLFDSKAKRFSSECFIVFIFRFNAVVYCVVESRTLVP